jgi:peptidoglycan/LPS O-acetylase OafA/YrhL
MISGFVIAHLVLETREPYQDFITKRFFRIYPVYAFCLVLAVVSTHAYDHLILTRPWGAMTPNVDIVEHEQLSLHGYGFAKHYLAHLTLLHGLFSDDRLYGSARMFLAPAWSLSLEWQFYLLAPLIIPLMLTPVAPVMMAATAIVGLVAFKYGAIGHFELPSTLAFGGAYFLLGILTRLMLPTFPVVRRDYVISVFAVCLAIALTDQFVPIIFWAIFVFYLRSQYSKKRHNETPGSAGDLIFSSRIMQTLGKWSYSTYLVHVPIIQLLMVVFAELRLNFYANILAVIAFTIPITLFASYFLHTFIELPFIEFGKRRVAQRGRTMPARS